MEENLYKRFGIRLCQIRKEANMTQAEVAQRLGTVQSTYSGYELGTRKITLELLLQLSDIFGISPTYLAAGINDPVVKVLNPQKDALNRNYDALNAEGRKRLVDYSDDLVSGGRYMMTAAHGGGVKKVPAPDPSKEKEIERLTREALLNSFDDDEEF